MSDLELLPQELQKVSASSLEIVLSYQEALWAIDHLTQAGVPILGWEGWIRFPGGELGHSESFQGTTDTEGIEDKFERAEFICHTIEEAWTEWQKQPETDPSELLFCITTEYA
jgi:hypothetical protein